MIRRRCVNPFCCDIFEEFGPVEEWWSVGDSCSGFSGDPGVFSVCGLWERLECLM